MKLFFFIFLVGCATTETFQIIEKTENFSQLVAAVTEVIDKVFTIHSRTINFMSADTNKSKLKLVRGFKDALLMLAFESPRAIYRLESTSYKFQLLYSRRRATIFIIETFEDFVIEHKMISPEFFKIHGWYVVVLVNGRIPEIEKIFKLLWSVQIHNVALMYEEANEILVFTFFPFNLKKCDDMSPVLINKIIGGRILNSTKDFYPNKMSNLFNCSIRLATSNNSQPFVIATLNSNGSYDLSGFEIVLINTLAKILNFHVNVTYIGDDGYILNNGTSAGCLKLLLNGDAEISVASWWIKQRRTDLLDYTSSYTFDKLALIVPPGRQLTPLEKLIYPFTPAVRYCIFAVFFVGLIVIKVTSQRSAELQSFIFGSRVQHPNFNYFIGLIGGVQKILPRRNFARFLLMSFLLYSLVLRTLYQASYFKFFQTNRKHKHIQSIEEVIEKDWNIYTTIGNAESLEGMDAIKNRFWFTFG